MCDQLVGHLALGFCRLLQAHHLVDENLVCLVYLIVRLLQGLDLVLHRQKLIADDAYLLRCRDQLFCRCSFSRRWRLPTDAVEVVFPVCPELRMLELPCLRASVIGVKITARWDTYSGTVWRLPVLVILSDFVEVVLVELSHKAGKVAVLEVFGQDRLRKLLVLSSLSAPALRGLRALLLAHLQDDEAVAFVAPSDYRAMIWVFQHPGQSVSSVIGRLPMGYETDLYSLRTKSLELAALAAADGSLSGGIVAVYDRCSSS
jgi:hypothetical protein